MRKKISTEKIIFIIYCIILIWVVLFKASFSLNEILLFDSQRSINLIPFNFIADMSKSHIRETLMNLFAFIPFGLYLPMINVSTKNTILSGCVLSFVFELCQFIFKIGISDITDIITNTLGALLGICLYFILRKLFSDKQKAHRIINRIAGIILSLFFILFLLLFITNI